MRRSAEDVFPAAELLPERIPWPARLSVEQVIEAFEPLVTEQRRLRLTSVVDARIGNVTLLMDAPHDPHNGAAVVRTSEAFGLPEIHVVPRAEEVLMAKRVARGAEHWVDVTIHEQPALAVASLKAQGFTLVATHPEGSLVPEELSQIPKLALLLGNEHDGLREEIARAADASVRIPMRGFVESLNVSVAAAVLLAAATKDRAGDLSRATRRMLYARGLFRTVPRPREVLLARYPEG
jgi:tRNA (guanosine-2'-O-)-methyltransferase